MGSRPGSPPPAVLTRNSSPLSGLAASNMEIFDASDLIKSSKSKLGEYSKGMLRDPSPTSLSEGAAAAAAAGTETTAANGDGGANTPAMELQQQQEGTLYTRSQE